MERLVMFSGLLLTNFNVYLHNFNSHEICDKKKNDSLILRCYVNLID